MPRSSKLSGARPEKPAEHLVEIILTDVLETSAMPFRDWLAQNPNPLIPQVIRGMSGYEYRVTQKGVDAVHRLTDQEWRARGAIRQTIARDAFNKISFQALGDAILDRRSHIAADAADGDVANEAFFAAMLADYRHKLEDYANAVRRTTDRHIPCNLFHPNQDVSAFAVGPVEFLPRPDWLVRYCKDGVALSHIQAVEDGKTTHDDLRARALGVGSDTSLRLASELLGFLNGFAWIATLRLENHELVRSHEKATLIVGLAIDAVGLRFQVDDARRFTKAGRQHLSSENRLATSSDGKFLTGWATQMPGLSAAPGALAGKISSERPYLEAAGKVLTSYLQGRQTDRAPHLVERWANALYWVGEARREGSDFMAVVNYGCAADGLSGAGGNATKMIEFAEAALNPQAKPVPSKSISIADAVNRVYREGRNKLAHGEAAGLLEDLTEIRSIGDALLAGLFDVVTSELAAIIDTGSPVLTVPEDHAYRALETRLKARR